jgi:hypothetical protein
VFAINNDPRGYLPLDSADRDALSHSKDNKTTNNKIEKIK